MMVERVSIAFGLGGPRRSEIKGPINRFALTTETSATTSAQKDLLSIQKETIILHPVDEEPSDRNRRVLTNQLLIELEPENPRCHRSPSRRGRFRTARLRKTVSDPKLRNSTSDARPARDSTRHSSRIRKPITRTPLLEAAARALNHIPTDPLYDYSPSNSSYQWHLRNTGQNEAVATVDANIEPVWRGYLGDGIIVAVIDDGIETTTLSWSTGSIYHSAKTGTTAQPPTFPRAPSMITARQLPESSPPRATMPLAERAAASKPHSPASDSIAGDPSDRDKAESMQWAKDQIQIKNNSWVQMMTPSRQALALTKAALADSIITGRGGLGTIHVWAAGNGGDNDNVNYDGYANSIYTIAVGAVTDRGVRADYSEPGAAKVISAPSDSNTLSTQGITTTHLDGSHTDDFGGTSAATPIVAGVIALMLEANPELGWRDVQEILIRSAKKIAPDDTSWATNGAGLSFSHDYGAGMVDALLAVETCGELDQSRPTARAHSNTRTRAFRSPTTRRPVSRSAS